MTGPAKQQLRTRGRELALDSALRKRRTGVPTYTIAEAAALCSVSQEHLYRLVREGAFPSIRMRNGQQQGRYIIPAKAVDELLNAAAAGGGSLEVTDWVASWNAGTRQSGGAA